MRIPRIYCCEPLTEGGIVELSPDAANHVTRVLRLRAGAPLVLFDGNGGEYEATLEDSQRGHARASIQTFHPRDAESPLSITLVQAVSKGERMDYTIQKAVELGITEVIPVLTERSVVRLNSERRAKRRRHWQAVAISACEQCGRNYIPPVHEPADFRHWLIERDARVTGLVLTETARQGLDSVVSTETGLELLIGPEGGLSEAEIANVKEAGFRELRLGPRTLRTETAAVAALAAMQTLWGDYR